MENENGDTVCGCEDPNAEGADCACTTGFIAFETPRGIECLAPVDGWDTLFPKLATPPTPPPEPIDWPLYLSIAALAIAFILAVLVYFIRKGNKELHKRLNS